MPRAFLILVLAAGLSACASTATDATAEGDDGVTATAEGDGVATTAEGDGVATSAAETKKPKKRCRRVKTTSTRLGSMRICKKL